LLSGFARCGLCGGGLATLSRPHGRERVHFYGWTSFWKRGVKVCSNNLVARIDRAEAGAIIAIPLDLLLNRAGRAL
jgi:hypothetical protein